jgi:enoyl-CoA hydratase/carnithine racemase
MNAHTRPEAENVLLREDAGGVAVLTLNRPQARNPLGEALLAALARTLADIAADRSVKAVILAAQGPVFCAGHDLKEMSARRADIDRGRAYFSDILGRCSALMQQITGLPQPVIAAVEGTATAAGVIASKSPATVNTGKRAFYEQREMGLKAAYDHASAVMVENMLARDAEEGIGAFMEKRAPVWEG